MGGVGAWGRGGVGRGQHALRAAQVTQAEASIKATREAKTREVSKVLREEGEKALEAER